MVIFAIPLRAAASTSNWDEIVHNFEATIESIFNQTSSNFKVIVACNDIPTLNRDYDERLEFIKVDIPVPQKWIEMARDKFWKLTEISVRIRKILDAMPEPEKGIYVMPVDADDLLNRRIVEWCDKNPNENGAVSKDGYVWEKGKKYLKIYPEMHTYCGSCNIIKMYQEDLPEAMPYTSEYCHDQKVAGELNARYPIRYDHGKVVGKYKEKGKTFAVLPFRSTIYVLGTGENISTIFHLEHNRGNGKKIHPIAFLRKLNVFQYKRVDKLICETFGLKNQ